MVMFKVKLIICDAVKIAQTYGQKLNTTGNIHTPFKTQLNIEGVWGNARHFSSSHESTGAILGQLGHIFPLKHGWEGGAGLG